MFFALDPRMIYVVLILLALSNILTGGLSLTELVLTIPGVLIAITFHEFAHAFVADKLRR